MFEFDSQDIELRLYDYIKEHPSLQNNGFEFRASGAGACPRQMDYEYQLGKPDIDFNQACRMMIGTNLHEVWQSAMQEIFADGFVCAEKEVKIPFDVNGEEHFITGHPDGVVVEYRAVYELKTVSEHSFQMVARDGFMPAHYEQANMYAYALDVPNILFHYYNRNDGKSLWFLVPSDRDRAEQTIEKYRQRVINKASHVIAERPYVDKTASPCWFCSYKDKCYEGFEAEVKAMVSCDATEEMAVLMDTACRSRGVRLDMEKVESEARLNLAKAMLQSGFNEVESESHRASVKVGKNSNALATVKERADV